MASVGIITFLHNENYGSSLQAYALQKTVEGLGFDCTHLNYCPDRGEKIRNLLQSGNSLKLIADGLRKRSVHAGQLGARDKREAIDAFYRKHMKLTHPCRNGKELRAAGAGMDILLCGSDQIWNPAWLNPAYFLTFAPKGQRKIAYAPSLGIQTLPNARKIRMIRKWTEGFEAISVREEEGAEILRQMTGTQAEVMPDPVCLLSREEWRAVAEPVAEEPFLLCYFIGENAAYWERVREISRETGLPVRVAPVTAEAYRSGYELLSGMGPERFLGAVQSAALLCTDSFHGLVFATIFGVRTELLRRYREEDPESKNSRVDHFRRLMEKKSLPQLREEGRAWLARALEG